MDAWPGTPVKVAPTAWPGTPVAPPADSWPGAPVKTASNPVDPASAQRQKPPGFLDDVSAGASRRRTSTAADLAASRDEVRKQPLQNLNPLMTLRQVGDVIEQTPFSYVGGAGEAAAKRFPEDTGNKTPAQRALMERETAKLGGKEGAARAVGDIAEVLTPLPGLSDVKAVARGAAKGAEIGRDAVQGLKRLAAPATVSETSRSAASIIRRGRGENTLAADQSAAKLAAAQKAAGRKPPEWHRELIGYVENRRSMPRAPDAPEYRKPDTSTPLGKVRAKAMAMRFDNTEQQRAADTLRDVYRHWQARAEYAIHRNRGAAPQFIRDYYVHIWKEDPDKVVATMDRYFKQGSGSNFHRRSIPTMEDGIKAGLTPKYENAFEATQHYVDNMSRFLTTHDIQGALKAEGHASWHLPGTQPEGHERLNGIMTERVPRRAAGGRPAGAEDPWPGQKLPIDGERAPRRLTDQSQPEVLPPEKQPDPLRIAKQPGTEVDVHTENVTPKPETPKGPDERTPDREPAKQYLYAPPEVARVYNNHVSKSLAATPVGPVFKVLRDTTNAGKLVAFGLSWAHAGLVGTEGVLSEIAGAYRSATRIPHALATGDLGRAAMHARSAGGALARAPVAPFQQYLKGRKFANRMLAAGSVDKLDPISKAFARSGNQLHMADIFKTRGAGSFYQSIARGSLREDAVRSLRRVVGPNPAGGLDRLKGAGDFVANVVQTAAAPLMEHAIPHAKQGAWLNEMERWRAANPDAPQSEIDREAERITDSIDNRMGEMLHDNIFWHKWIKESAQIALQSYSFTVGTFRELAGGVKDIPESARGVASGKGISPRTAYVAALATYVPMRNAIYQYLKTGKPPEGQDWLAPQTGGTNAGQPERAGFLGNEKDVYGYFLNPYGAGQELAAKQTGELRFGEDVASGKDWRSLPIAPPAGAPSIPGEPNSMTEAFADDFANSFTPFALGNQRRKAGSNISGPERSMGIRPAGAYMADPKRAAMQKRAHDMQEWMRKVNADKKAQAQMEQP